MRKRVVQLQEIHKDNSRRRDSIEIEGQHFENVREMMRVSVVHPTLRDSYQLMTDDACMQMKMMMMVCVAYLAPQPHFLVLTFSNWASTWAIHAFFLLFTPSLFFVIYISKIPLFPLTPSPSSSPCNFPNSCMDSVLPLK